jgi:hypothetical protein
MTSEQVLALDPDKIAKLPSREIPSLVTAAITLDRAIKLSQEHLALLKSRLVEEAQLDFRKLDSPTPTNEGHTYTYTDQCGQVAHVVFPGKRLIGGFTMKDGKAFYYDARARATHCLGELETVCGPHFKTLFQNKIFKPVKGFREILGAVIISSARERILKMVELPSSPRVTFGTAASATVQEEE